MRFIKPLIKTKAKGEFYPYFTNPLEKKRFTHSPKFFVHKLKKVLKAVLFLAVVGFGVYLIYFFIIKSTYFDVNEITIYGSLKFVNQTDLKAFVASNITNKNIIYIDTRSIEAVLKKTFLGAKDIKVTKAVPNKLQVHVTERTPLAVVAASDKGQKYLMDEEGYILGSVAPEYTNLPLILYTTPIEIGKFLDSKIVPVTEALLKETSANNLKISSISYKTTHTSLFVSDSIEALIGNEKSVKESVRILAAMIRNLTLEGKKIQKVDLRYDKVIVLYD